MINGESVRSKEEGRERQGHVGIWKEWGAGGNRKRGEECKVIKYLLSTWGGKAKKKVRNE